MISLHGGSSDPKCEKDAKRSSSAEGRRPDAGEEHEIFFDPVIRIEEN
jgi:hypothetical protein